MANPIVTFEMENGDVIKAELYPEIAPNTVNNFITLVQDGFYNGLIFHRVIRDFMIQHRRQLPRRFQQRLPTAQCLRVFPRRDGGLHLRRLHGPGCNAFHHRLPGA